MSNIISVKDMCLWYGEHKALNNVNIEIPEKSITAFIGPSGCGKSTFLKTLNRMNDLIPGVKITGDIRYDGSDIFSKDVDMNNLRKEIGMVFQKPNPFPMSIYDNVAYGPRTHGITNKMQPDEIVEQAVRVSDYTAFFLLGEQYLEGLDYDRCRLTWVGADGIVLSAWLAHRMAKHVVEPLNKLDLDKPMENEAYEELSPLLHRIHAQHMEIKD